MTCTQAYEPQGQWDQQTLKHDSCYRFLQIYSDTVVQTEQQTAQAYEIHVSC